jgi:hypothetical protein
MTEKRKISELTEVTTLSENDELVFVKYEGNQGPEPTPTPTPTPEPTPVNPATLVLQPYDTFAMVGGPVVGMPTATVTSWTTLDQVISITAQWVIVITQNWSLYAGSVPPMYRYTFQSWQTNIPGFNGSANPVIRTTNLELGKTYTAKPIYTKTQIN